MLQAPSSVKQPPPFNLSPHCRPPRSINANTWTAGVGTSATLDGSAGAYLSRSELSPNLPLTEAPVAPKGLVAGRRRRRLLAPGLGLGLQARPQRRRRGA
jgi:hypothetical protein